MIHLKGLDEGKKRLISRIAGLVILAFTIFIFVATISYLFTWKSDMSLTTDSGVISTEINADNMAGKLGFKMGHSLISNLFGLGSFFIVFVLVALSLRYVFNKWQRSLLKTILIGIVGALLSSITLAYIGFVLNIGYVFGGGLGGRCGNLIVLWANNLVGTLVLGVIIVIAIIIFLILSSNRFNNWLNNLGNKPPKKHIKETPDQDENTIDIDETIENQGSEIDQKSEADSIEDTDTEDSLDEQTAADSQSDSDSEPTTQDREAFTNDNGDGKLEIITDSSGTLNEIVTQDLEPIDIRLDAPDGLPKYQFPSLDLLDNYEKARKEVSNQEVIQNNNKIRATLANFKIQISDITAIVGPTITLYKVYPAPGVTISDIKRRQNDIAIALKANGVRAITLNDSVGIEVANSVRSIVPLKNMLNSEAYRNTNYELPVAIGYTITQEVKVFDLTDAPHLLVAGATKQGKSVGLNVIINSLIYCKHPAELKFVFIDPKMVEFSAYNGLLKHFLAVLPDSSSEEEERENAIVKSVKDAEKILRSLCIEMDERYKLMSAAKVNKITNYNEKFKKRLLNPEKGFRFMPYLVIVIDEYADLAASASATPEAKQKGKSIMNSIIRLASKGRAAGLHVILATQRPSVNIISGDIKANFPMRIAFRTLSGVDSKTILDMPGAEKLVGKGDMLFYSSVDVERLQCALIDTEEIERVTNFISSQTKYGSCYNTPYYLPTITEENPDAPELGSLDAKAIDERFKEAAEMLVLNQKGSTSDLQRRLGMGYARAGRVMDQLEAAGIVGPQDGTKTRQVLVSSLDDLSEIYKNLNIY